MLILQRFGGLENDRRLRRVYNVLVLSTDRMRDRIPDRRLLRIVADDDDESEPVNMAFVCLREMDWASRIKIYLLASIHSR